VRVLQRVPHTGLRGKVDYSIERLGLKDGFNGGPVRQICLKESEAGVLQPGEPRLLERDIIVFVEVIDAEDFVSTLQQAERKMHSNEAGGAGDQNLGHGFLKCPKMGLGSFGMGGCGAPACPGRSNAKIQGGLPQFYYILCRQLSVIVCKASSATAFN
jgi:hypothetical protein